MKRSALVSMLTLIVCCASLHAQDDAAAYRAASGIQNPVDKIRALEEFVKLYPDSKMKSNAYNGLFGLSMDQGNKSAALDAAMKYLGALSPEKRMSPYNQVAFRLAENNVGLDSALVFAERAEEMARTAGSGMLSAIQDTRAFVLFRKGNSGEAEKLQLLAMKGHENDPEYESHLALYEEGNGKRRDALKTMSKAIYLGGDAESREKFFAWLELEEKDTAKRTALKQSMINFTVHAFVDTLRGEKAIAAKSTAAGFMADMGVDLSTARKWAESAVAGLKKSSSTDDMITFKENLALVIAAQGKYQEALTVFTSVAGLVNPWETKFWLALGSTYEHLGEPRKAIDAYLQGLLPWNPKPLRNALEAVYKKEHGSVDGIEQELDQLKQSSASVDPGRYDPGASATGKVVLAELFTGAECGPCAAADAAFDALAEFYPRSSLAILEYHLHIPGADPMTTNDSWGRYNVYGGDFGTPTVLVDGKESITGGGPKYVATNRFNFYRYAIQKYETENPRVNLTLTVKTENDDIIVNAGVVHTKGFAKVKNPVLHVALVERSVDYTGANGVSKHLFVVRKLFGGPAGTPLSSKQSTETFVKQINLAEVEQGITEYLDNPTIQPSWRAGLKGFSGWRARPEKLDRSNLAIVAWVQDMKTKEILQSVYRDAASDMGLK